MQFYQRKTSSQEKKTAKLKNEVNQFPDTIDPGKSMTTKNRKMKKETAKMNWRTNKFYLKIHKLFDHMITKSFLNNGIHQDL